MISWLNNRRYGPIGIDLGSRSVKLVQLSADRTKLIDAARWDLPVASVGETVKAEIAKSEIAKPDSSKPETVKKATDEEIAARSTLYAQAIEQAMIGRSFKGREVVVCLSDKQLSLQSVRVPREDGPQLERAVLQETAGRLTYPIQEAEVRFVPATDVRQGEQTLKEVIVFAAQKIVIQQMLGMLDQMRLEPVALDVEPAALARCYSSQYRREADQQQRALVVHVGYSRTAVTIAQGSDLLFVKYLEIGGKDFDQAIARHLKMPLAEAQSLRKLNGDRRTDQQDPAVQRSISDAQRSVVDKLAGELSMCVRYHGVTFRGQPIARLVLGGGEANQPLLEAMSRQMDLPCELSDPFRGMIATTQPPRKAQWDIATGLALREIQG